MSAKSLRIRSHHTAPSSRHQFLALIVAVLTAACQPNGDAQSTGASASASRIGAYRIAGPFDVVTLDPALAATEMDAWITGRLLFGQLYSLNSDGVVRPELAATPADSNADQTVFTVTLRSNLIFDNGRAINAADVVFSVERLREKGTSHEALRTIDGITEMRALDDQTIVFRLAQPQANFPARLASTEFSIVPRSETLIAGDAFGTRAVIGSGPYRLTQWTPGSRMRLEPRSSLGGAPPIELIFNAVAPVAIEALKNGQADYAWFGRNAAGVADARSDGLLADAWRATPSASVAVLWMNPRSAHLEDAALRRRIAHQLDRSAVAAVTPDTHPITALLTSPAILDAAPIASTAPYTSANAIAPTRELTLASIEPQAAVQAVAASLRRLGLQVRIVRGDPARLAARIDDGSIDFVYASRRTDPDDPTLLFTAGSTCDADALLTFCTPTVNDLVARAQAMPMTNPKRMQFLKSANEALLNIDVRIVPVLVYDMISLCSASATTCTVDARFGFPDFMETR